jgi:hypothetical protein
LLVNRGAWIVLRLREMLGIQPLRPSAKH